MSEPTAAAGWTWPRQMSTYAFWGLLALNLGSDISIRFQFPYVRELLMEVAGLDFSDMSGMFVVAAWAMPVVVLIIWAAIRWPYAVILSFALLQITGLLLVTTIGLGDSDLASVGRTGGAFLNRVGATGLGLTVIVVIASAKTGLRGFAVAFGAISMATAWVFVWVAMVPPLSASSSAFAVWFPMIVGLLFFLPVNRRLFSSAPEIVYAERPPMRREPAGVFFLVWFVPFYVLYWVYRIHAEARSLDPELDIPSARSSVPLLLIPFFAAVLFSQMRTQLKSRHPSPLLQSRSIWPVALLGVLFPPAAAAMVQSDLNAANAQAATAAA